MSSSEVSLEVECFSDLVSGSEKPSLQAYCSFEVDSWVVRRSCTRHSSQWEGIRATAAQSARPGSTWLVFRPCFNNEGFSTFYRAALNLYAYLLCHINVRNESQWSDCT